MAQGKVGCSRWILVWKTDSCWAQLGSLRCWSICIRRLALVDIRGCKGNRAWLHRVRDWSNAVSNYYSFMGPKQLCQDSKWFWSKNLYLLRQQCMSAPLSEQCSPFSCKFILMTFTFKFNLNQQCMLAPLSEQCSLFSFKFISNEFRFELNQQCMLAPYLSSAAHFHVHLF